MIRCLPSFLNPFRRLVHRAALLPVSLGPRPLPLATPDLLEPAFVAACPVAQKYRALLGPLDWSQFPERPTDRPWPGPRPQPRAPFVAAYLVKLHEQRRSMGDLRTFLILLDRVTLLHIHRFDPNDRQLADALVASAVVFFRKEPPPHVGGTDLRDPGRWIDFFQLC